MPEDELRSRAARRAAESALVRVVHHYGSRPEFVVLGGLVPEFLCALSEYQHAGTTDIDVQVDLEIAWGAVNAVRLEQALRNAEFEPDCERVWRWRADGPGAGAVVKFELLADLDDQPAGAQVHFDGCESLGAANLRGTGFASRDAEVHLLSARMGGIDHGAEVNVAGLAGFLLAKSAAARSRHKPKDWYALAFVLLHNDAGNQWKPPRPSSSGSPTTLQTSARHSTPQGELRRAHQPGTARVRRTESPRPPRRRSRHRIGRRRRGRSNLPRPPLPPLSASAKACVAT